MIRILTLLCAVALTVQPGRAESESGGAQRSAKLHTESPEVSVSRNHPDNTPLMHVVRDGEQLYIASRTDAARDIVYHFRRCMFNKLYTFYRVGFRPAGDAAPSSEATAADVTWVNTASSDNIGPMRIAEGGWCGANHSYLEAGRIKTAHCEGFKILTDGKPLKERATMYARRVEIRVRNTIYNPAIAPAPDAERLASPLCTENAVYSVEGNSIRVTVRHAFLNETPVTILHYYGMQSMFAGEDLLMTPGGRFADFTPVTEGGMNFSRGDYPAFRRFIEKNSANGTCQSSWLLDDGLGSHAQIDGETFVFTKSSGKAYHHLVCGRQRMKGDETSWSGLYTWFQRPIADDADLLIYAGRMEGCDVLFIDAKRAFSDRRIDLPARLAGRKYTVLQQDATLEVAQAGGKITVRATAPASAIVRFSDNSEFKIQ